MPRAIRCFMGQVEADGPPDVLIHNHLMVNVGVIAWMYYGIRTIFAQLGLEFHFAPRAKDAFNQRTLSTFDALVMAPSIGRTIADMTPRAFNALYTSPDRLLGTTSLLKEVMLATQDKNAEKGGVFTGFWIFAEDRQLADPAAFGGPELLADLVAFLRAGPLPVYLGWGSMPLAPRMLAVAAAALSELNLRAIIVRGWSGSCSLAGLREALRTEGRDAETCAEICAHAEEHVLFADRAPHEWLFPQCACTVHHGGAGTTAAALRAGVPTVVVPLGYDQTYHGDWVESLGVGVRCSTMMDIEHAEFVAALERATSDDAMRGRAREAAEAVRREPGVAGAVAYVRQILRTDVRSGLARQRWEKEGEEKREFIKKRQEMLRMTELAPLMVGHWHYGSKPSEYQISRRSAGSLWFTGPHSGGGTVSGMLGYDGLHYKADLVGDDGTKVGQIRLRFVREDDTVISNFIGASKAEWGKDIVASRRQNGKTTVDVD